MKKTKEKKARRKGKVILLEDLAPREDIQGGSGRLLFGQHVEPAKPPEKKRRAQAGEAAPGSHDEE
jgi:hypothetical protein